MRAGVVRQSVRADHGTGMGQDALNVFLVHLEITRAAGLQAQTGLALAEAPHCGDIRQKASGHFGMRFRSGNDDVDHAIDEILAQHRRTGGVGIDVKTDGLAGRQTVDQRQGLMRAPPVGRARALVMREHQRQPAAARGAGSFLLALSQAGRALSDAASAQRSPFVLGTDVFDVQRNMVGALLGALPLSPTFATRRLGLGPGHVRDQQRALAQAVLADLRVAAFRVLLRELLISGKRALHGQLPELSDGALGFELPESAAGVFIRVRPRDSQRFVGALLAASRHETLLQTHDEDWFRNPRAIAELRSELSEPSATVLDAEALTAGAALAVKRVQALL